MTNELFKKMDQQFRMVFVNEIYILYFYIDAIYNLSPEIINLINMKKYEIYENI